MLNRRIAVGTLTVGAAAIALTMGATAAQALTTVTVSAGSAASGSTVAVTGTSGTVTLKDLTSGLPGSCTSSSLPGSTKVGSNSPSSVGTINAGSATFNSCTTAGLPFQIAGVGTWTIAATANSTPASTNPASGQTTATSVTGINASVTSTSCNFSVTGTASGTYTNGSPSTISLPVTTAATSGLTVSNLVLKGGATSCLAGAVKGNGDKISLSTTYNINANTSSSNPVWVNAK